MGGGGHGSTGSVDFSTYLKNYHSALLTNSGSDDPLYSIVDLFNGACGSTPFDGITSYSGYIETGEPNSTLAQIVSDSVGLNSDDIPFSINLEKVSGDIQSLFDTNLLQSAITKWLDSTKTDYARLEIQNESNAISNGLCFSSSYILNKGKILDLQSRVVMDKSLLKLSEGIMQIGSNKLVDTLNVCNTTPTIIGLTKQSYKLCVEHVKMKLLNAREYTEQNEYYLKHRAVWRFECMQEVCNAITHLGGGRKFVWVDTGDVPKWAQALSLVVYAGAADNLQFGLYKQSKRFRYVASETGKGFVMGLGSAFLTGSAGAIIGGAFGMISGILSYREGDWR